MRTQFRDLVPVEEARKRLAPLAPEREVESVPLAEAAGRVLAEPIEAGIDVPGFDRAAMDGYAVRADDVVGASESDPARLALAGEVPPGQAPTVDVGTGEAVEISTGAVLPEAADAVVMVEDTERDADEVVVRRAVAPGDNVAPLGEDVATGERVLPKGRRLDPRDVGTLAAVGVSEVPVAARPRVALVSTGDEVRPVDAELGPGEIHDVNRHSLAAAVRQVGGEPVPMGRVDDDVDAMQAVLEEAVEAADLVVTSGSTSASQVDVLYRVVEEGGEMRFHGVDVKPGKPMFGAAYGGVGVVGLPGYPVSALTTFRLFVAPLIRLGLGRPARSREDVVDAAMADRVDARGGRPRLLPVGLVATGDGLAAYPVDRGSGATTSLVDADGVVEIPGHTRRLDVGEAVDVALLARDVPADLVAMGEHCPGMQRLLDRTGVDVKWLRVGAREATRRAERGIPDAVGTNLAATPDGLEVVAAWRRRLVLVSRDVLAVEDLDGRRLAGYAPGTGLGERVDATLDAAGVEPTRLGSHRSPASCARAVAGGRVEAAIVPEAAAGDLARVDVGEETYRVLSRSDRDKPGIAALRGAADPVAELVGDLPGYEPL